MKQKVIVGMSGGVDSSVSALLLKNQGYDVVGLFMKNWEDVHEDASNCSSQQDYEDVVRVCDTIGIPYYTFNFTKQYQESVFSQFLEELQIGYTPNPDILCNREIKFKVFFEKALELGADFLATGHYAQIKNNLLYKGVDPQKDQTYFLYTLKKSILQKILFPIGTLHKAEVRKLASLHQLPTALKKDSTGICFIGEKKFTQFLQSYIPYQEGDIKTLCGKTLGKHLGIAFYTIGQRKGLKIGGQKEGTGNPWFVVKKDVLTNTIYVTQEASQSQLYQSSLLATQVSWIDEKPPSFPYHCQAKIRYRQEEQPCKIEKIEDDKILVSFFNPQRAITPRQSIVFYEGSLCLGGALIEKAIEENVIY